MAILKHGTWVLIADGEKALFLRNDLDEQTPDLNVVALKHQDNPPDHDQGTNRPGRKADHGMGQTSALEETDWHQLAKERFAAEVANMLYQRSHAGEFDEIILIAPPRTLGELREKLHQEVRDKVVAELPKTLTNRPLDKIEDMLQAEFGADEVGRISVI